MSAWGIASMALSGVSAIMGYSSARASYKAQKKIQEYQNKMANVSNALNQNAITSNMIQARKQSATQAVRIQQQGAELAGSTSVQAAATGTIGASADQAMLAARQAEAMGEADREDQLESYMTSAYYERVNSAHAAAMQQDYTQIEKPNAMSYAVNAAASIAGTLAKTSSPTSTTTPVAASSYGDAASQYKWLDLSSYGGTRGF